MSPWKEKFLPIFLIPSYLRVLARPYLMMLYVIFSIYLNFWIRSQCILKAIIHRKKQWIVLSDLRGGVFFQEDAFYDVVYASCIWLIFPFFKISSYFSCFFSIKKKNFMAPFYGWGSTASRLEPLWGGSLLFTTNHLYIIFAMTHSIHAVPLIFLYIWKNLFF